MMREVAAKTGGFFRGVCPKEQGCGLPQMFFAIGRLRIFLSRCMCATVDFRSSIGWEVCRARHNPLQRRLWISRQCAALAGLHEAGQKACVNCTGFSYAHPRNTRHGS